ncbi:rRNA-processing protein utp21 [Ophidiomyces ophidiicola]|nr:rRNA-processing protein utp21 [Ophidiomyces ophidiicola]KAI1988290.1 rRNA-processing protein utp21 [Ophidiomyces ophidiicola]KAI1989007.1 rRNA-processing protein utp21 [Ophidiomyces ophidiicola]KAI2003563.1 rRNA-processing protein utp21 [Ophidiomyces ophidiicola]
MPSIDDGVFGVPLAKRQKVTPDDRTIQATQVQAPSGSRIFSPFRTLGLVSPTSVPFTSVALGKTTFQITTSVGKCLQTYDLRRGLNLVFLTRPETPGTITSIYAWKDCVFAAWGGSLANEHRGVWVFKRGKKIAELEPPANYHDSIEQLMVFGSWIIGCGSKTVQVWKTATYQHYTTLIPPAQRASSTGRVLTGKMCSMPTYLNKVFVGRYDGGIDIWNVSTGKLLYTLLPSLPNAGAVTAMEPTPALSVLAVAYSSGALVIHNIRTDQPVLQLRSSTSNALPISSISFRTDDLGAGNDGRKAGVMATCAGDSGDITMWDLNDGGRVTGILRDAHEASGGVRAPGINKIKFLSGQPVLISTGTDNALRSWVFDETPFSPIPRPLHARSGHSAPITTITFLPPGTDGSETTGKWLLSASKDHSLYGLSLRKDGQNAELSQGKVKSKSKKIAVTQGAGEYVSRSEALKTPEITCIACSLNRDGGMGSAAAGPIWANAKTVSADSTNMTGWESVVTGHKGDRFARTWLWGKRKAGRWTLETGDGTEVKSVAVSSCGTFALVGSDGGSIDTYNLQSGIRRQSFPTKLSPAQLRKARLEQLQAEDSGDVAGVIQPGQGKHTKAVTGIVVDSLNTTVISCSLDGKVKFWDFATGRLKHELDWYPMCAITGLRCSNSSDLIALTCDDLSIRVIDTETKKLVRELWGCVGQVNDFCISHDGRWVIAASMDSVIRVWDLPTGHLIDAFRLQNTCTSLAFSATGEFLATAHADGVGVNLWNNQSLFTHIPTSHIDEDAIVEVDAPTASGEGGGATIEAAFREDEDGTDKNSPIMSAEQLGSDMMTLSITPKNRWQALLNLDLIKQRNKPKEAPKAPKKAPFFLPSTLSKLNSEEKSLDVGLTANNEEDHISTTRAERTRIAKLQQIHGAQLHTSHFTSLLHSSRDTGDHTSFIEYLKSLSPAKADIEIRSLDPINREYGNEMAMFVTALVARLKEKRDFEMVNAWMAVFLRVHADSIEATKSEDVNRDTVDSDGDDNGRIALQTALSEWKTEHENEGKRLAELVGYCRGIVGFLRSAR